MAVQISPALKATGYALALGQMTGEQPNVKLENGSQVVYWSEDQLKRLSVKFTNMMDQPPGEVQVQAAPIFYPYIIKKVVPYVLGAAAVGYLVGKL